MRLGRIADLIERPLDGVEGTQSLVGPFAMNPNKQALNLLDLVKHRTPPA